MKCFHGTNPLVSQGQPLIRLIDGDVQTNLLPESGLTMKGFLFDPPAHMPFKQGKPLLLEETPENFSVRLKVVIKNHPVSLSEFYSACCGVHKPQLRLLDRKSTRLNS